MRHPCVPVALVLDALARSMLQFLELPNEDPQLCLRRTLSRCRDEGIPLIRNMAGAPRVCQTTYSQRREDVIDAVDAHNPQLFVVDLRGAAVKKEPLHAWDAIIGSINVVLVLEVKRIPWE